MSEREVCADSWLITTTSCILLLCTFVSLVLLICERDWQMLNGHFVNTEVLMFYAGSKGKGVFTEGQSPIYWFSFSVAILTSVTPRRSGQHLRSSLYKLYVLSVLMYFSMMDASSIAIFSVKLLMAAMLIVCGIHCDDDDNEVRWSRRGYRQS